MRCKPFLMVLLTLLTGCAGRAPPETFRYLLRADQSPAQRAALETPRVGIGRVEVAPYLDQLGIVLETAPGQIHNARNHLWAEPLDQGLKQYLRQSLSDEIGVDVSIDATQRGGWEYALDVRFEEFHGTDDGDVRIAVEYTWTAIAADDPLHRSVFADVEPLSGDGYEVMVIAHKALLGRLVGAIADGVPHERVPARLTTPGPVAR